VIKVEVKGKASAFLSMLKKASLDQTFTELVLEITDKEGIIIRYKDGTDKTTVTCEGKFRGFETIKSGEKKGITVIGIKVKKIMDFMKDIFDADEDITFSIDKNDLVISGGRDVIKTPIYDPMANKMYLKELSFMIDPKEHIVKYGKKGDIEPSCIAEVDSKVLKDIAKRSAMVGQEYYPINIAPPNKIFCQIGSRKKEKTTGLIDYSDESALVKGEAIATTLGKGFKEVCSVLDDNVKLSGLSEEVFKKQAPLWVFEEGEDHEIGFMIAPRIPE
jgi:hypothetical protein